MRFALNSLAVVVPDWLLAHSDAGWTLRYGHRIEESCLPKSEGDRHALAELIGEDGWIHQLAVRDDKPTWAKSAIPSGPDTKSTSPKPVNRRFLT